MGAPGRNASHLNIGAWHALTFVRSRLLEKILRLCGRGRLILAGCYLGDVYREKPTVDFEKFGQTCVNRSGWRPKIKVRTSAGPYEPFFYIKSGISGGKRLIFVFFSA